MYLKREGSEPARFLATAGLRSNFFFLTVKNISEIRPIKSEDSRQENADSTVKQSD